MRYSRNAFVRTCRWSSPRWHCCSPRAGRAARSRTAARRQLERADRQRRLRRRAVAGLHQPDQPVRELVVAAVARPDPRAAPPGRARRQEQLRRVAAPDEMPTLANGGVTGSGKTFTVTYHLNPDAKWEPDGTPITSADVMFTWHAVPRHHGQPQHDRLRPDLEHRHARPADRGRALQGDLQRLARRDGWLLGRHPREGEVPESDRTSARRCDVDRVLRRSVDADSRSRRTRRSWSRTPTTGTRTASRSSSRSRSSR